MLDSSFVLHDVAPSQMDDVTQDMSIRDERARQEPFFFYSGLSSQTLSDTTEEKRHVQTRKHKQVHLSTGWHWTETFIPSQSLASTSTYSLTDNILILEEITLDSPLLSSHDLGLMENGCFLLLQLSVEVGEWESSPVPSLSLRVSYHLKSMRPFSVGINYVFLISHAPVVVFSHFICKWLRRLKLGSLFFTEDSFFSKYWN